MTMCARLHQIIEFEWLKVNELKNLDFKFKASNQSYKFQFNRKTENTYGGK